MQVAWLSATMQEHEQCKVGAATQTAAGLENATNIKKHHVADTVWLPHAPALMRRRAAQGRCCNKEGCRPGRASTPPPLKTIM
jgi:hypothetical protein